LGPRIIFFAGKGGVGKTSVAAATGVKAAEMGSRTIVMSLDAAHSLSDAFDLEKGLLDQNKGRPVKIRKNLWIQELDIQEEIQKNWGEIHGYLSVLLNTTGLDAIVAEDFAVLPGMEEVSLLLHINRYVRKGCFDAILLDCAPTGESIRFIGIPGILEWYIKKLFKLERTVVKYVRPLARKISDVPLPDDDYFQAVERLFERLRGVDRILTDPQTTTVRLVTNPEKMVLKETQRAFMYFCLYKMNVDAVIMNRVLPERVTDAYFATWKEKQEAYMARAERYFAPIPIFHVELFSDEMLGYQRLKVLADSVYRHGLPLQRFFEGQPYELVKEETGYRLTMRLPFADKKEVELSKVSEELIVRLGAFKRHVLLPRQVAASKSVTAKFEGQHLSVYFEGVEHE